MTRKFLSFILVILLVGGCSRGRLAYYKQGNLHTRVFLDHVSNKNNLKGDYFEIRRNKKGQIISAKHLSPRRNLIEKSSYSYNREGQLNRHHTTEYFDHGPPRTSKIWIYDNGKVVQREEKWFTRSRLLEKKLTIYYDKNQKPFTEQTWGLGNKIESSTEYYYDYKHHLDKSRRNFFLPDGNLRDYWLTIYNDQVQIITEEHYLPDNSLIAFYRYTYHPVKGYREYEEILDENQDRFVFRKYNKDGFLLLEEVKTRKMILIKRLVYEYGKNQQPLWIYQYDSAGILTNKSKYKKLRTLNGFKTTGI